MTFKAYIDNVKAKTSMSPEDFHRKASSSGFLASNPSATQFVAWLANDYDLGRGHAMAIFAVFKSKGWMGPGKAKSAAKAKKTKKPSAKPKSKRG